MSRQKWLIVVGIIGFFSCSAANAKTYLTFGKAGDPGTAYRLVAGQSLINNYQGEILASGTIDFAGSITAAFSLEQETITYLFIGAGFQKLWLVPADSLVISTTKEGYVYAGLSAPANHFLSMTRLNGPSIRPTELYDVFRPKEFISFVDSMEASRQKIFEKSFGRTLASPAFSTYCRAEISGSSAFLKNQYALHFIYTVAPLSKSDVPADYFSFWNKMTLMPDYQQSDMYINSLSDYISYLALKRTGATSGFSEETAAVEMLLLDSILIDHPKTRQEIKARKLSFLVDYFDYKFTDAGITKFNEQFPGSKLGSLLTRKYYRKFTNRLSQIEFELKDEAGRSVSIKDFKGKLIYIDFWGSWCTACLQQIPAAKKLQKQFKSDEVVFLNIDFYDNGEKWKNALVKYGITGINVKAENSDEAYFESKFGISVGFPRYALVDHQGKLITASAPHPAHETVTDFIRSYLL
jgi:thiol-disulfide isomerase/thioredoxin